MDTLTKSLKTLSLAGMIGLLTQSSFAAPVNGDIELKITIPTVDVTNATLITVYSTNNVAAPVANWPKILTIDPVNDSSKSVVGTNTIFTKAITVIPGFQSFVISATSSNFWGVQESFLNTNSLPSLPSVVNGTLGISKK